MHINHNEIFIRSMARIEVDLMMFMWTVITPTYIIFIYDWLNHRVYFEKKLKIYQGLNIKTDQLFQVGPIQRGMSVKNVPTRYTFRCGHYSEMSLGPRSTVLPLLGQILVRSMFVWFEHTDNGPAIWTHRPLGNAERKM